MTTYGNEPLTNEPLTDTGTSSFGTYGTDTSGSGRAADETASTTSTATDQAKNVAGTAKQEAANVAGTAAEQARNVVGDVKQQVGAQLSDQTTTQRDKLSQTLRTFGDDLQQMAEQGPGQGMATDLAHEVSERVRAFGAHLEGREPTQLLDDARDFARRRPGTFLIGALAAGVVAGRLFRATADGAAAAELDQAKVPTPRTQSTMDTVAGVDTSATTAVPRADFAAAPPTLADPDSGHDPMTEGLSGRRTMDTP